MVVRLRLVNAFEIKLRLEREGKGRERKKGRVDHMFNYEHNPNGSASCALMTHKYNEYNNNERGSGSGFSDLFFMCLTIQ